MISEVNNFMFNFDYFYDDKNTNFEIQFKKPLMQYSDTLL